MTAPQHEHEFEAAPGLPEPLPTGERVLWQGAPDWRALCLHTFHLRKLAAYFALMLGVQALYLQGEPGGAAAPVATSAGLAFAALGLLALAAWLTARTTLYTLTSRRVVMRIGIVLTITLNVPLRQVRSADLRVHGGGAGDVSLALLGQPRLGWLHLWPHARPWQLREPQPSLRCIPDAAAVGARLHAAWQAVQAAPGRADAPGPAQTQQAARGDAGLHAAA